MPRIVAARIDRKFWTELNFSIFRKQVLFSHIQWIRTKYRIQFIHFIQQHRYSQATVMHFFETHSNYLCYLFVIKKKIPAITLNHSSIISNFKWYLEIVAWISRTRALVICIFGMPRFYAHFKYGTDITSFPFVEIELNVVREGTNNGIWLIAVSVSCFSGH